MTKKNEREMILNLIEWDEVPNLRSEKVAQAEEQTKEKEN